MKIKTIRVLAALAIVTAAIPSLGQCDEDLETVWEESSVGDTVRYRAKTQIRGVTAQEESNSVPHVLELCAATGINARMECEDRKVYLPTDNSELLYQTMDIAKLALASDAYVVVGVDRNYGVKKLPNGCELPRVLSLSILSE